MAHTPLTCRAAEQIIIAEEEHPIKLVHAYCQRHEGKIITVESMIDTWLLLFNDAARDVMQQHHIPFLGIDNAGKVVLSSGTLRINRPLRDAEALINSRQLSHYLESGEILYSDDELHDLIS